MEKKVGVEWELCYRKEGGGRARSAQPTTEPSAGDCAAERGRAPPPTLRHGRAGDARGGAGAPRRERPTERSGATQEGGNTPPTGQRAERAEGRGDGGEGAGGKAYERGRDPTTRLRAQRTIKRRRRGNFRARTGREDSMDERHDKRAKGSVATRSEPPQQGCPPIVARGADARRHAAAADSQGRSEAEPAAGCFASADRREARSGFIDTG